MCALRHAVRESVLFIGTQFSNHAVRYCRCVCVDQCTCIIWNVIILLFVSRHTNEDGGIACYAVMRWRGAFFMTHASSSCVRRVPADK